MKELIETLRENPGVAKYLAYQVYEEKVAKLYKESKMPVCDIEAMMKRRKEAITGVGCDLDECIAMVVKHAIECGCL